MTSVIDEVPQEVIETIIHKQDAKSFASFMMSSKYVHDTFGAKLRAKVVEEWASNLCRALRYIQSSYCHVAKQKEKMTLDILKIVLTDLNAYNEQIEPPELIFMSQVNHITKYINSHIGQDIHNVNALLYLCNINARASVEWGHEEENQVWYWFQKYFFGDILLWHLEWETKDLQYKFMMDFERGTMQFNVFTNKSQQRNKKCLVNSGAWQEFHNQGVRPIDNEHLEVSIADDVAMKRACAIIAEMIYDTFGVNQLMTARVGELNISAHPYIRNGMDGGEAFYYNSVYLQKQIETSIVWCKKKCLNKALL